MIKPRLFFAFVLLGLFAVMFFSPQWSEEQTQNSLSSPSYQVVMEMNVMVPMRDGVRLATDIYRPNAEGKFPVVLIRTPYGSESKAYSDRGMFYAQRGYVSSIQDCRGKYDSEGDWYGKRDETKDGDDTLTWLGTQSWSSGKVGMVGSSYLGIAQWLVSYTQNPYLKALVPVVGPITLGRNAESYRKLATYCNNNASVGSSALLELSWLIAVNGRVNQNGAVYDLDEIANHLPMIEIPKMLGRDMPSWKWLLLEENGRWEQYFKRAAEGNWTEPIEMDKDFKALYAKVNVPILQMSGWFDCASDFCFYNYQQVKRFSQFPSGKNNQHVMIGPWNHWIRHAPKIGEFDFGPDSVVNIDETALRWFDRWLKDIPNGIDKDPPVKVFVMGKNEWIKASDWPIPETVFTPYYLHSEGKANSVNGDGFLSAIKPENEPPDKYVSDPANPTPSVTGLDNTDLIKTGPVDMSNIEKRDDVLVYTSSELQEDVEVTGPLHVVLYVSTSAPATDFFVRLMDVHPSGKSYPVFYTYANPYSTRGLKAVDRDSNNQEILMCEIELPPTSNLFFKGHHIRVEISSSAFPLFRNLNIDGDIAHATEFNVANQTIYHDKYHPSYIVLPIIPQKGGLE
ncbi:CocE/NonD family hydrolase [Acidobacteriota bacterium]